MRPAKQERKTPRSSTERRPFEGIHPPYPAFKTDKPPEMSDAEFQVVRCVSSGQLFGVLDFDGEPS